MSKKVIFRTSVKIVAILLLLLSIILGFVLGGGAGFIGACVDERNYSEEVYGDWIYCYNYGELYVKDLSETGKQKTAFVFPSEFKGQKVKGVLSSTLSSAKLEVLYFTHYVKKSQYECPNLSKVVLVGWEGDVENFGWVTNSSYKIYVRNGNPDERTLHKINGRIYYANTNFYYNYENAPRRGVYWIDNFEWGGKIEYMPENPTREGYAFAGWYLESECINQWNNDSCSIPKEKVDESGEVLYQETSLYAKWIKS